MWIEFNNNPCNKRVGDCSIRAISTVLNESWDSIYMALTEHGYAMCDMPSSNSVIGSYLRKRGFERIAVPNTCPDCYTVKDFCIEHPNGSYILATGSHVVAVIDGNYLDSWDSGDEVPIYFYTKGVF